MVDVFIEKIKKSMEVAEKHYYKLVLLVGDRGCGKTFVLNAIANEYSVPVVNVNLELSESLIKLTQKQRQLRVSETLNEIVENQKDSPKVLDNIEILFDVDLKQEPLRLLKGISRNHLTIASWNGSLENGKLIYAEQNHSEYQSYDVSDILVVKMDKESRINSAR
jgi:6-phosphogluconate dehydrogenase